MLAEIGRSYIGQNVSRRIKKAKRRSATMARTAFPSIMSGHARITAASLNGLTHGGGSLHVHDHFAQLRASGMGGTVAADKSGLG
jgi:hypothetical protein